MKTPLPNTTLQLDFCERTSHPVFYSEDPDSPTEQERDQHKIIMQEWEARGGHDLHRIRVTAMVGPTDSFQVGKLHGLKRNGVISPEYNINDTEARLRALNEAIDFAFESARHRLTGHELSLPE